MERGFDPETIKEVYFNKPQLRVRLIDANEVYCVWGRGTGKTNGVLAPRAIDNMLKMPRSSGFIVHGTYQGLKTRILPAFVEGLERLGLIRGLHYDIGTRLKGADEPYTPPIDYSHAIHFINGCVINMISQDITGSSNGLNTDWGLCDEAKYLKYEQFTEETLPTMRANRARFKHLSNWQSLTFTTSMPTASEAKWILKKEQVMQSDRIEKITALVAVRQKLVLESLDHSPNSSIYKRMETEIKRINAALNILRIGDRDSDDPTVYFSKASSFDNIDVLGIGYIRKMRRLLPDFQFRTEIKNEEVKEIEGGFYANLNIGRHTYEPMYDNSALQSLGYDQEDIEKANCSLIDLDCNTSLPLTISIDWGTKISCLVVGQDQTRSYRFLKNIYVKHPELVKDLANAFIHYYRFHKNKTVEYPFYGSETERVLSSTMTYVEEFAEYLRAEGWTVHTHYRGQQPDHHERYLFYHNLLSIHWDGQPVEWNKYNCKEAFNSMLLAPAKQTPKGIAKDKKSERNESTPQEEATHFSDAVDTQIDFHFMRPALSGVAYLPHR